MLGYFLMVSFHQLLVNLHFYYYAQFLAVWMHFIDHLQCDSILFSKVSLQEPGLSSFFRLNHSLASSVDKPALIRQKCMA